MLKFDTKQDYQICTQLILSYALLHILYKKA